MVLGGRPQAFPSRTVHNKTIILSSASFQGDCGNSLSGMPTQKKGQSPSNCCVNVFFFSLSLGANGAFLKHLYLVRQWFMALFNIFFRVLIVWDSSGTAQNSYTVSYTGDGIVGYVYIQYFLSLSMFFVAVITPLVRSSHSFPSQLRGLHDSFHPVITGSSLSLVPVVNLLNKCTCTCIDIGDTVILAEPTNHLHFD